MMTYLQGLAIRFQSKVKFSYPEAEPSKMASMCRANAAVNANQVKVVFYDGLASSFRPIISLVIYLMPALIVAQLDC